MKRDDIESVVPLLPMQQSFLLHSLHQPPGSSVIQLQCTLHGRIDADRLQQAWDAVTASHQALRSTVHWQSVSKPVQLVHRKLGCHIVRHENATASVIQDYLQADREQGLDLTRGPTYRLALFQTEDDHCQVVWSMSHVVLDGWSSALLVEDWIARYSALLDGKSVSQLPAPSPPLTQYTRWIAQQDREALLQFWSRHIPRITDTRQAPAVSAAVSAQNMQTDSASTVLDTAAFSRLQQSLRQQGIGLGTVLQAALAVAVRQERNSESAVFSTTVSGRHIDVPMPDRHVGMFINTVPVYVPFSDSITVVEWLRILQSRFYESLPHSHVGIHELLAVRPDLQAAFDTLLVLENHPGVRSSEQVAISGFQSGTISDVGRSLLVVPGDTLQLVWQCREERGPEAGAVQMLQRIVALLESMASSPEEPLQSLLQRHAVAPKPQEWLSNGPASDGDPPQRAMADAVDKGFSPMSTLERSLRDIWSELLQLDELDRDASFFELGGTSFQALQMFSQIEERLEVKLPATVLFDAPSLAGIAALIETDQPRSLWSSVLEINPEGSRPPLFIPFEHEDILMYRHLCRELGADQPVYGLRIAGDQDQAEDMTADLLSHIKRIQPEGPCLLAGSSGAGLVAWDIAQRLRAEQREVAMLALLDTYGPGYPVLQPPVRRLISVAAYIGGQLASVALTGVKRSAALLSGRRPSQGPQADGDTIDRAPVNRQSVSGLDERIRQDNEQGRQFVNEVCRNKPLAIRYLNLAVLRLTQWRFRSRSARMAFIVFIQGLLLEYCREKLPAQSLNDEQIAGVCQEPADGLSEMEHSMPALQRQWSRYRGMYASLQPYDAHVRYYKAAQRPPGVLDDALVGWQGLLLPAQTTVHMMPGNHNSMLQYPCVRQLAETLAEDMEKAVRQSG